MTAHIITIGDEILIGQIIDTNSAWMGQQLNMQGIQVGKIVTVSDKQRDITNAVDAAFSEADIILLTGGLGPTKDDITKKALTDYFGVEMRFSESTYNRIQRLFQKFGKTMTEAHHEQSYMPSNADLLMNKMGTAPGMWFEHDGKVLVSMPGVPYEMKYLMEAEVLPKLKNQFPGKPISHRTVLTVGEGESRIAERIDPFLEALPPNIKMAYLPGTGQVRLRMTGIGDDENELNRLLDTKVEELKPFISEFIFGFEKEKLEEVVGKMLLEKGKTLSTAESCTGGFLAHKITSIPGSSAYFSGSVIAYSNAVKMNQLQVKPSTLKMQGAVSEETVKEMVRGTLDMLKTDIAIAISGIAGPDGGTPEKPVGTIWIGIGDKKNTKTYQLNLWKDRMKNIEYTTTVALNVIRKFLLEL
ncbi:MAG: competence/damage-inducible protein A [Saprospiraceae bacterium]|nr:competence/damage-inducible protein A [Saprospiraceae bacterium]